LGYDVSQEWRPWTIDGKEYMGGYVTRYNTPSKNGTFDYLTIRGAGHMVPQYKPKESLEFIDKWLKNEDWLPYTPPNTNSNNYKMEL